MGAPLANVNRDVRRRRARQEEQGERGCEDKDHTPDTSGGTGAVLPSVRDQRAVRLGVDDAAVATARLRGIERGVGLV